MSWFELFYDLVIVAAVAHGGHVLAAEQSLGLGAWLMATFAITFLLWFSTTLAVNLAPGEVPGRKSLMFVQMIALTVANLSMSRTEGLSDTWGLVGLLAAFATVAGIFALVERREPSARPVCRPWILGSSGAVVVLAVGALMSTQEGSSDAWWDGWLLATAGLVALLPAVLVGIPRVCRMHRLDPEHLSERLGQFVIIVLGESFLSLVLVLDGLDRVPNPVFFALGLIVAGALWAVYFTSVHAMGLPASPLRLQLWLLGFLVFLIGAAYSASMHASYASRDWQSLAAGHPLAALPALYALAGALVLGMLGGVHRDAAFARIHAVAVAILVIAWPLFVLGGLTSGNGLLVLGSGVVILDSVACLVRHRRLMDRAS